MTYQITNNNQPGLLEKISEATYVAGTLHRTSLCLNLYQKGERHRARTLCNNELINFLRVQESDVKNRKPTSMHQLHGNLRLEDGTVNSELLRKYRDLFRELLSLATRVSKDEDFKVPEKTLKELDSALTALNKLYAGRWERLTGILP